MAGAGEKGHKGDQQLRPPVLPRYRASLNDFVARAVRARRESKGGFHFGVSEPPGCPGQTAGLHQMCLFVSASIKVVIIITTIKLFSHNRNCVFIFLCDITNRASVA